MLSHSDKSSPIRPLVSEVPRTNEADDTLFSPVARPHWELGGVSLMDAVASIPAWPGVRARFAGAAVSPQTRSRALARPQRRSIAHE